MTNPAPPNDELKAASEALNNAPVPMKNRVVGFPVDDEPNPAPRRSDHNYKPGADE